MDISALHFLKCRIFSPWGKQEKLAHISINKVPSAFSQAHLGNVLNPLGSKGLGIDEEGLLDVIKMVDSLNENTLVKTSLVFA